MINDVAYNELALARDQVVVMARTNDTTPLLELRARWYVETHAGSSQWRYVASTRNWPQLGDCVLYADAILRSTLGLALPDPDGDPEQTAPAVSSRYRCELYEYVTGDLVSFATLYHESGNDTRMALPSLTAGQDYLVIINSGDSALINSVVLSNSDGSSTAALNQAYSLTTVIDAALHLHLNTNSPSTYTHLMVPHGVKVEVYKWTKRDTHTTDPTPVILAGVGISDRFYKSLTIAGEADSIDSAVVIWVHDPKKANDQIMVYVSADAISWQLASISVASSETATITDLEENTHYYIKAKYRSDTRESAIITIYTGGMGINWQLGVEENGTSGTFKLID